MYNLLNKMILDLPNTLLYIHPREPPTEPIEDELTDLLKQHFYSSIDQGIVNNKGEFDPGNGYMGVHTCTGCICEPLMCSVESDAQEYLMANGMITNSLCIHYVQCHRHEIPDSEMTKLLALKPIENPSTEEEMYERLQRKKQEWIAYVLSPEGQKEFFRQINDGQLGWPVL